jgi:TonB family protein
MAESMGRLAILAAVAILTLSRGQPISAADGSDQGTSARPSTKDEFLQPYVEELKRQTPPESLDVIGSMNESELIQLHFTYGLWIRNNWLRGNQKPELIEYFKAKGYVEPDGMSGTLIHELWRNLHANVSPEEEVRWQAVRRIQEGQVTTVMSDFTLSGCSTAERTGMPAMTVMPVFVYPKVALKVHMQGTVVLRGRILAAGNVDSIEILKSLNPVLDSSAIRHVQAQTFRPARCGNRPVEANFDETVMFVLQSVGSWSARLAVAEASNAYEMRHPDVLTVGPDDSFPRAVKHPEPDYPDAVRRPGRALKPVVVEIVINSNGDVEDPEVIASDRPDMNPFIIEALRNWKYEPPRQRGKPVAVFMTVAAGS